MEYVVFGIVVTVIVAIGIRVGMLLAPRIDRLTTPDDEEPRD
jgi:hypothetical protein